MKPSPVWLAVAVSTGTLITSWVAADGPHRPKNGHNPVIANLSLSALPFSGDTLTLRYDYHDPDCDDTDPQVVADYCAPENEAATEIGWQVNGQWLNAARGQRNWALTAPDDWDWQSDQPLLFKLYVHSYSLPHYGQMESNSLEYTGQIWRGLSEGDNSIVVGDTRYYRPAFTSDTLDIETEDEIFDTPINQADYQQSYAWSERSQQKAIDHCQSNGLTLASREQMIALLSASDNDNKLFFKAKWPMGTALYLTADQQVSAMGYTRAILFDINSETGEFLEQDLPLSSPGLAVCVAPALGYASEVIDSHIVGASNTNTDVDAVLGAADGKNVSLGGAGGWIKVKLDAPAFDHEGYDMKIYETGVPEAYEVCLSPNDSVADVCIGVFTGMATIDLADYPSYQAHSVQYVLLKDAAAAKDNSGGTPGADIDAIEVLK